MTMLDEADHIWNRACDPGADQTHAGDQALQALLRVHGQVMNGGLVSALEYNAPEEIAAAVAGLRYFRLDGAAEALDGGFSTAFPAGPIADPDARGDHLDALGDDLHARLEQLEADYNAAVPRDAVVESAFRERLRESPHDFAPLR